MSDCERQQNSGHYRILVYSVVSSASRHKVEQGFLKLGIQKLGIQLGIQKTQTIRIVSTKRSPTIDVLSFKV